MSTGEIINDSDMDGHDHKQDNHKLTCKQLTAKIWIIKYESFSQFTGHFDGRGSKENIMNNIWRETGKQSNRVHYIQFDIDLTRFGLNGYYHRLQRGYWEFSRQLRVKIVHVHVVQNIYKTRTDSTRINLLKPTGHVMHQQFNIQQLYVLSTLCLCVLYLSENKQRLVPLTA